MKNIATNFFRNCIKKKLENTALIFGFLNSFSTRIDYSGNFFLV